jgi:Toxin SymE, type I toxin-antitoxin system
MSPLPLPQLNAVFEQIEAQTAWRDRRRARAAAARANGRRFGTICGRWQGRAVVPDLRLSGHWLQRAGFDLGQQYEIEVRAGRLTIRAV